MTNDEINSLTDALRVPTQSEEKRLAKAKLHALDSESAIAYAGCDSEGGVVYINPSADKDEIRKALIVLAAKL